MTVNKVLYDPVLDRRQNICDYQGEYADRIKMQASSVACFIHKNGLIKDQESGKYILSSHVPKLSTWIKNRYNLPLAEEENFREETVLGYGTGFLVTDRVLMTAAHVICKKNSSDLDPGRIANSYIVFNYSKQQQQNQPIEFAHENVYTIKKVISYRYARSGTSWADWALVQLDRKVSTQPLQLDFSPIQNDDALYMLGYPNGLPLKYTGSAWVMKTSSSTYFECKIDAFAGNSGSPLCRWDTGQVVGMLCEGNSDYVVDDAKKPKSCVSNRLDSSPNQVYEKCQRCTPLSSVKDVIDLWGTGFKLKKMDTPPEVQKKGFYILGQCTQPSCSLTTQPYWMTQGIGTFSLDEILYGTHCTNCKSGRINVLDLGVYDSQFTIEGILINPNQLTISKTGIAVQVLKTLDQGPNFLWSYWKIQVFQHN